MQPHDPQEPYAGPALCGAKLRKKDATCKNTAGFRTDHPGQGRCYLHGGRSPVKHGRYAKVRYASLNSPRIGELLDEYRGDGDPLDLLPELALLRSLVHDFIERFDVSREALIRWNLSFNKDYRMALEQHLTLYEHYYKEWADAFHALQDLPLERRPDPMDFPPGRPLMIVDILQVGSFITQIGNLSERIYKRREQQTFTMATVSLLIEAMGGVLLAKAGEYINDPGTREAFLDAVEHDWQGINVAALARRKPQEDEAEGE